MQIQCKTKLLQRKENDQITVSPFPEFIAVPIENIGDNTRCHRRPYKKSDLKNAFS